MAQYLTVILTMVLLILQLPELHSKCVNHLDKKSIDDNFLDMMAYESAQMEIVKVTTTCTNVSLLLEGFVEHFCENCTREIMVHVSNIPTLRRLAFYRLKDFNILRLQGTNTSYVEPGIFAQINKLRELYFTNNDIRQLGRNIVSHLVDLKILDLSQNGLIEIDPQFIDGNLNLRHLNLSLNELPLLNFTQIDHTVKLISVDVRYNRLTSINFGNATAKFVYLSHNILKKIEDCTLKVYNLDISYNNMSTLPMLNKKCSKYEFEVRILKLSNNVLTQLRNEFFQAFPKLTSLDISNNMIQHLPTSIFRYMPTLNIFDVSHNILGEFDVGIFVNESGLEYVNMSYNQINRVKGNIDINHTAKNLDLKMQCNPVQVEVVMRLLRNLPADTQLYIDFFQKGFTLEDLIEIREAANKSSIKIVNKPVASCIDNYIIWNHGKNNISRISSKIVNMSLLDDINGFIENTTMSEYSYLYGYAIYVTDKIHRLFEQFNNTLYDCISKTNKAQAQETDYQIKAGGHYAEINDDRILLNVVIVLLVIIMVMLSILITKKYIRNSSCYIRRRGENIELLDDTYTLL